MTPAEFDKRIIRSRQTYHRYKAMMDNWQWPKEDLHLFSQEILHLNMMVQDFPEKAEKVARLVDDWKELWRRLRAKMN